jgi:citrate lyase subunit beta / citryl-CoA lyase
MTDLPRPLRSALYMPAANARALEKARGLAADAYIFDLEDAVQPDSKSLARDQAVATVQAGGYGAAMTIIRINGPGTIWHSADVAAVARSGADAVLLPKVQSAGDIQALDAALAEAGAPASMALWAMIETPRAVLAAEAIAQASSRLTTFAMGLADLAKDLRAQPIPGRATMFHALSHCVMVARAFGLSILDGVHVDLKDTQGLAADCAMARAMGYDGKTLVHPDQIAVANQTFAPSRSEVDQAIRLIAAYEVALEQGRGVAVLDGKMVEVLHVEEARRLLAVAEQIANR